MINLYPTQPGDSDGLPPNTLSASKHLQYHLPLILEYKASFLLKELGNRLLEDSNVAASYFKMKANVYLTEERFNEINEKKGKIVRFDNFQAYQRSFEKWDAKLGRGWSNYDIPYSYIHPVIEVGLWTKTEFQELYNIIAEGDEYSNIARKNDSKLSGAGLLVHF